MQLLKKEDTTFSKYILMFPLFIMIIADYLLALNVFEAVIDYGTLKIFLCVSAVLSLLKCFADRFNKWVKIAVIFVSLIICIATLIYVFKPFLFPIYDILKDIAAEFKISVLRALFSADFRQAFIDYLYTVYMRDYIDRVILAAVFVVYNLLFWISFIRKKTVFLSAVSIVVLLFGLKFKEGTALVCQFLILFSILFLLLIKGFSKELNKIPFTKNIIAVLMIVMAIVVSSAFIGYADLVKKPSNFISLRIFEDFEIFKITNGAPDYYKYLFDKKLGNVEEVNDDKVKVLSFNSSYPVNRLVKAYFFDYDVETGSFLVENPISDEENEERTDVQKENYNRTENFFSGIWKMPGSFEVSKLEEGSERYPEKISITNYSPDNIICFPYGSFVLSEGRKLYPYMDKGIVTDYSKPTEEKKYDIYFDPNEVFKKVQEGYDIITTTTTHYCSSIEYDDQNNVKACALLYDDVQTDTFPVMPRNMNYYEYVKYDYTRVPSKIQKQLRVFLAEHNITTYNPNKLQLIEKIRNVLNTEFEYVKEEAETPEGEDPIVYFLTTSHKGNSKLFAAAETLLYRTCNIPARYVYGYKVPEITGKEVDVYDTDEYAWSEVNLKFNWTPADNITLVEQPINEYQSKVLYQLQAGNGEVEAVASNETSTAHANHNYRMENTVKIKPGDFDGGDPAPVMTVKSSFPFTYLCMYSCGDYDITTSSFRINEDYSQYVSIADIKDFGEYYRSLQFTDEEVNETIEFKNSSYGNLMLRPYGMLKMDETKMYLDKYVSFYNKWDYRKLGVDPGVNLKADETYSKFVKEKYCNVPEEIRKELIDYLFENDIDFANEDKMENIYKIVDMFRHDFLYTYEFGEVPEGEDINLYFLKTNKKGWCMHFASSATLLFRVCGIPSRLVTGFLGDFPANREFDVMSDSSHAWVEIYTKNYGWYPVEVTVAPSEKMRGSSTEYGGEADFYLASMNEPMVETAHDVIEQEMRLYPQIEDDIEIAEEYQIDTANNGPLGVITVYVKSQKFRRLMKKLLPYIAALIVLAVFKIMVKKGIFNPFMPTLLQNINMNYVLIDRNGFTNEKIYSTMERIRFSAVPENPNDLYLLNEEKNRMYLDLKKNSRLRYTLTKTLESLDRLKWYLINIFRRITRPFKKLRGKKKKYIETAS